MIDEAGPPEGGASWWVPRRGPDGYFHPATEAQLVTLVRLARAERKTLRVRGSAHSIRAAIHTDARLRGEREAGVDVRLDRYAGVRCDEATMRVEVQAGCHLGADPRDPLGAATWERSLLFQLDARGWALPDLGGVTHQTISGFLSTGSCGGTIRHAIEDALVSLRLIDGTGQVHELVRGRDDAFDAAICSLGLLGVISTVTLQCVPAFHLVGREDVTTEDDCAIRLFEPGPQGLAAFFRDTPYARLMWWPQPRVHRVVAWQARRMAPEDYDAATGPADAFVRKPYLALGDALGTGALAQGVGLASQHVGGAFYDAVEAVRATQRSLERRVPAARSLRRVTRPAFERAVLPAVLRAFVPVDGGKPQRFWDTWHQGLPMDNQMSERALPTTFTELFLPLDEADAVMRTLRDAFHREGLDATGTYIHEIYAARATSAWLHPSYGRDSLRLDVFWFERNREPAEPFFRRFWELCAPFGYRLHWGKVLPSDPRLGAAYLRQQLPRWDDFLALRETLDPDGVFLTDHWRHSLGIA